MTKYLNSLVTLKKCASLLGDDTSRGVSPSTNSYVSVTWEPFVVSGSWERKWYNITVQAKVAAKSQNRNIILESVRIVRRMSSEFREDFFLCARFVLFNIMGSGDSGDGIGRVVTVRSTDSNFVRDDCGTAKVRSRSLKGENVWFTVRAYNNSTDNLDIGVGSRGKSS
jgi:hypothetical protein